MTNKTVKDAYAQIDSVLADLMTARHILSLCERHRWLTWESYSGAVADGLGADTVQEVGYLNTVLMVGGKRLEEIEAALEKIQEYLRKEVREGAVKARV